MSALSAQVLTPPPSKFWHERATFQMANGNDVSGHYKHHYFLFFLFPSSTFLIEGRDVPNPNNSTKSEFIRKRIVPFLINRIENMNIRIRLLINRIGVWSIRVIPIRNRIHSLNIPYEPNNNRIFQRVKNMNEASTLKVILNLSNFQPEKILFLTST